MAESSLNNSNFYYLCFFLFFFLHIQKAQVFFNYLFNLDFLHLKLIQT